MIITAVPWQATLHARDQQGSFRLEALHLSCVAEPSAARRQEYGDGEHRGNRLRGSGSAILRHVNAHRQARFYQSEGRRAGSFVDKLSCAPGYR